MLAMSPHAWTVVCPKTGRPLICAGVIPIWHNRGLCWANLDFAAGPVVLEATRRIRRDIETLPFKRFELYVAHGFREAWRWAHMLGFEWEAMLEAASPEGRDIHLFKRIKRGRIVKELGYGSYDDPGRGQSGRFRYRGD